MRSILRSPNGQIHKNRLGFCESGERGQNCVLRTAKFTKLGLDFVNLVNAAKARSRGRKWPLVAGWPWPRLWSALEVLEIVEFVEIVEIVEFVELVVALIVVFSAHHLCYRSSSFLDNHCHHRYQSSSFTPSFLNKLIKVQYFQLSHQRLIMLFRCKWLSPCRVN